MSGLPILYSFRRCPYAIRARIALVVSGTCCAIREVKLSSKPAAMICVSQKATVPVLVLPDGPVIDESLDIMHWALGRSDPAGWLRQVDEALIATIDGPFKDHLDHAKYPDRHDEDTAVHYNAAADLLGLIEARLASSDDPNGNGVSFTDAAILPFVRQFAGINHDAFANLPLPRVQGWLNRFLASSLFEAAMPRLLPWKEGDPEIHFPRSAGAPIAASW